MDIETYGQDYTNAKTGGPIAKPLELIRILARHPDVRIHPTPQFSDSPNKIYKWSVGDITGESQGIDELVRAVIVLKG